MRKSVTGVLALLVLGLLYTVHANYSKSPKSNSALELRKSQNEIKIVNKTNFQIVGTAWDETTQATRFTLKNNYSKSINLFLFARGDSNGDTHNTQIDLAYSDVETEIAPNQEHIILKPITNAKFCTIKAVLFTDGSGDGELKYVQELMDKRRGEKQQLQQGLAILRKKKMSSQFSAAARLSEIRLKLSSLPLKNENESIGFNSGLYEGRLRLQQYLEATSYEVSKESSATQSVLEIKELELKLERIISTL